MKTINENVTIHVEESIITKPEQTKTQFNAESTLISDQHMEKAFILDKPIEEALVLDATKDDTPINQKIIKPTEKQNPICEEAINHIKEI